MNAPPVKLLDQVRNRIRMMHYSIPSKRLFIKSFNNLYCSFFNIFGNTLGFHVTPRFSPNILLA